MDTLSLYLTLVGVFYLVPSLVFAIVSEGHMTYRNRPVHPLLRQAVFGFMWPVMMYALCVDRPVHIRDRAPGSPR